MSEKLLRLPEIINRTGLSKSTIYVLLSDGQSDFPRPIKILGSRAIAFVESEVDTWIHARIEKSRN
jgi:prophage regulatory protein